MQINDLDHVVVVAGSREAGSAWVEAALGARPEMGGEHARMGTHNALLRLGDRQYLEVIAIDPQAPGPDRPRWFGMDRLTHDSPPRLAAWVARTPDLAQAAAASILPLGEIESMKRGALSWQIAVPIDGELLLEGALPTLIQWTGDHPAAGLPDRGCRLLGLELFNPWPLALAALLQSIGLRHAVTIRTLPHDERPFLRATIETPIGLRVLGGP
ncbi:MAG: VOC family protein [Candidatus Dormibacterales bacterium]